MTYTNMSKAEIWSRKYWKEIERLLAEKEKKNKEKKAA